jgi:hypothetical protein
MVEPCNRRQAQSPDRRTHLVMIRKTLNNQNTGLSIFFLQILITFKANHVKNLNLHAR